MAWGVGGNEKDEFLVSQIPVLESETKARKLDLGRGRLLKGGEETRREHLRAVTVCITTDFL